MILYSRELLKHFLGQQWMLDYNMVEDTGFSEEELKVLYQKARSGELLQQKTSKKRIDLPASVYLKLNKEEQHYQKRYQKEYDAAPSLSELKLSEWNETLGGWNYHDAYIANINVKGSSITVTLLLNGAETEPVQLCLEKARILENSLPKTIPVERDAAGELQCEYWWIDAEVIMNAKDLHELHVVASTPTGYEKLAIEFGGVEIR